MASAASLAAAPLRFGAFPNEVQALIVGNMAPDVDGTMPAVLVALQRLPSYPLLRKAIRDRYINLTAGNAATVQVMSVKAIKKITYMRIAWGSANPDDHQTISAMNSAPTKWKMLNHLTHISVDLTVRGQTPKHARSAFASGSDSAHLLQWLCAASVPGVRYLEIRLEKRNELRGRLFDRLEGVFGYENGKLRAMGRMDQARGVWTWGDGVMKLKTLKK